MMFASMNKNKKNGFTQAPTRGAGFTILEIIVVIFIITMGLVGVLSLIIQNVQVQYVNKNNLIASQLAQECLELIRNIRDNNWLAGNDWDSGLVPENYYIVDYTGSLNSVAGISEAKLQLRDTGFYWHDPSDPDTIFSRLITITQPSLELLNISCLVQWSEKSGVKEYVVDTILYDWR